MSSSFLVLPSTVEEKYAKLIDSFQVSSVREMIRNPASQQASPLSSGNGSVGHLVSSSSRFTNDMSVSAVSPQGKQSHNSPFISQSLRDGGNFPPTHYSHSEGQSTAFINHSDDNKGLSWPIDPLQEFINFVENVPVQNGRVESTAGVIASEDHAKRTDWQEWADQLISVDDELEPNWSEILNDVNMKDSKQKVYSSYCYGFCYYTVISSIHSIKMPPWCPTFLMENFSI
jgi:hypothetical protein